jgi:tRNA-binding protein
VPGAPLKPTADFAHFEALDIRAGRIVKVEEATSRKPTWRMTIDLGPELGEKISCGALRNYPAEVLVGKTVICVTNFGVKRMGREISEVLVLGVANEQGDVIYLTTESNVPLGSAVF